MTRHLFIYLDVYIVVLYQYIILNDTLHLLYKLPCVINVVEAHKTKIQ